MKKTLASLLTVSMLLAPVVSVSAHPGRTDANGGHTCRTNCAKWGLKDGEYHFHNSGGTKTTPPAPKPAPKPVVKPAPAPKAPAVKSVLPKTLTVKIIKIVDGDTVKAVINKKEESIRLIGVDTPETVHPDKPVQPYGPEASAYTKKRLTNQTVKLEFDVQQRDKYGRLLAYVWIGKDYKEMSNQTLVKEGYAVVLTIPPNVKYTDSFVKLQQQARAAKKGLWK